MSLALRLAARVIARRVQGGEDIEQIFILYPKMSENEREQVRMYVSTN